MTRLNYIDMHRESFGEIRMDLLIEDIVKRYHHMTKAQFKLDLKPVSFFGERESWRVALQCLLDNAIRYAEKQIKVSLKKDFLHICNDGPHIEEDRLANIFIAYEKSARRKLWYRSCDCKANSRAFWLSRCGEKL